MFDRFIDYAAKVAPDNIAIRSFDGTISYQVMNRDINRLAHALLAEFNPLPKVVAVNYLQIHVHWMFLMALSRIGVISASVSSNSDVAEKEIAVIQPDVVISGTILDIDTDAKIVVFDLDWYSQALKKYQPDPIYNFYEADRVVRVSIACGTSNVRHRIDHTASMIEAAIVRMTTQEKISWSMMGVIPKSPIFLPTLAFGSFHGFLCFLSIWSICGTVIMVDREQYPAAITMLSPDLMVISPAQLQSISKNLPSDAPRLDHLRLIVVASNFPNHLRQFVKERLTNNININYSTSEVGVIASINIDQVQYDDIAGWVLPWIDLQIVDDQDNILKNGEIGNIRIKGPGIVKEFYHNKEDTEKQFKDGWFYPGDLGVLNENSTLRLLGRIDEIYNFGGDKFYANKIDLVIQNIDGVSDAAFFSTVDENGLNQPWIAIVRGDNFDINKIGNVIEKEFYNLPDTNILWVNSIPRNDENTVLRYRLSLLASNYKMSIE